MKIKNKMVIGIMSVVILTGLSGSVTPNEVEAVPSKTKCVITDSGGFYCEGNPGYEQARNSL